MRAAIKNGGKNQPTDTKLIEMQFKNIYYIFVRSIPRSLNFDLYVHYSIRP